MDGIKNEVLIARVANIYLKNHIKAIKSIISKESQTILATLLRSLMTISLRWSAALHHGGHKFLWSTFCSNLRRFAAVTFFKTSTNHLPNGSTSSKRFSYKNWMLTYDGNGCYFRVDLVQAIRHLGLFEITLSIPRLLSLCFVEMPNLIPDLPNIHVGFVIKRLGEIRRRSNAKSA